jgi:methionyl-tRNA formyltransferase
MKCKFVFVALYDNSHGRYILRDLIDAEMAPCAIFIGSTRSTIKYRYRSIIRYSRKNGARETANRIIYRAFKRKDVLQDQEGKLPRDLCTQAQQHGIPLVRFANINSTQMVQALRSFQPDFLVLGGAPLLKRVVLDVPQYGVINTHPAKLPEIRGIDVVGWSILEKIPLGLSVFFVDEGIDTGPLLYFHEVSNSSGLNLEQIEQKLQSQAGIATVQAIEGFLLGKLTPIGQRKGDGKLYSAMPRASRIKVNELLQHS